MIRGEPEVMHYDWRSILAFVGLLILAVLLVLTGLVQDCGAGVNQADCCPCERP